MRKSDDQYMHGFNDELKAFIGRVKDRAQARIDKAMKEYEEVNCLLYPTVCYLSVQIGCATALFRTPSRVISLLHANSRRLHKILMPA